MAVRLWKTGSRQLLEAVTNQLKLYHYIRPHQNLNWSVTSRRTLCASSSITERDVDDTDEKGSELFETLLNKGVDTYSKDRFISLYSYLLDVGIKQSTIESQFRETPDLVKVPLSKWKGVCEVLLENGVSSEIVFKNISICPDLLRTNVNVLKQNVEKYREMYIGKQSLLTVVQRNPQLYVVPPKVIIRRMGLLDALFPPTELRNLVKNNPNILTDDWDNVSEKIMYIHEEMGLEQPHIAASEALQKSLLHIKIRHQFLHRAGLYIKPNLLRDQRSDRKNPELSMIMDTSNKFFTNKVARMTIDEYDVFCSMMKEEHISSASDDEDSDYDTY